MWTVLLVEDEKAALIYLRNIMKWEDYGFRVVGEARNGKEALGLIETLQPDVVITDIMMPQMDGVTLLKEVRMRKWNTRFVMLTAMSDFEYARQALQYEATDYLLKLSLDQLTLIRTLEKLSHDLKERQRYKKMDQIISHVPIGTTGDQFTDHPEINKVIRYILDHYQESISLQGMAEMINMAPSYLSDLFKKKKGVPLIHFIQQVRVDAAKLMLLNSQLSISEIGERNGFANDNYFIKIFKRWTGMTPNEFKKQGR